MAGSRRIDALRGRRAVTKPKVSILVPTHNRAPLLRQALESALAQDYENLEVVVSDNASTDGTVSLRERYASDPRVQWRRNPADIGVSANWRKLLYEFASGEYAKILCDDDYIAEKDHVSKAVRLIEANALGLVFSGTGILREPEGRLFDFTLDVPAVLSPRWWLENLGRRNRFACIFPNLATNAVFHAETARRYGAFENSVFGMDYELALKFMLGSRTGYIGGMQCVEREHPAHDGGIARLNVVMTGFVAFQRVREFGLSLGLDPAAVDRFVHRAMVVFVESFALRAWFRENGFGPRSWLALRRSLAGIDRRLVGKTLFSPRVIGKLALERSPRIYPKARMIYRLATGRPLGAPAA